MTARTASAAVLIGGTPRTAMKLRPPSSVGSLHAYARPAFGCPFSEKTSTTPFQTVCPSTISCTGTERRCELSTPCRSRITRRSRSISRMRERLSKTEPPEELARQRVAVRRRDVDDRHVVPRPDLGDEAAAGARDRREDGHSPVERRADAVAEHRREDLHLADLVDDDEADAGTNGERRQREFVECRRPDAIAPDVRAAAPDLRQHRGLP